MPAKLTEFVPMLSNPFVPGPRVICVVIRLAKLALAKAKVSAKASLRVIYGGSS